MTNHEKDGAEPLNALAERMKALSFTECRVVDGTRLRNALADAAMVYRDLCHLARVAREDAHHMRTLVRSRPELAEAEARLNVLASAIDTAREHADRQVSEWARLLEEAARHNNDTEQPSPSPATEGEAE